MFTIAGMPAPKCHSRSGADRRHNSAGDPAAADQTKNGFWRCSRKGNPRRREWPRVIDAAYKVCHRLDGGMPVNVCVDGLRNDAYNMGPVTRLPCPPHGSHDPVSVRQWRSTARTITAKMAFAMANFEPGSNERHRVAASTRSAVPAQEATCGVGVGRDHHVARMAGTDGCDAYSVLRRLGIP